MEEITCQLCSAASHLKFNAKGYVQHIQLFHAHKANFRITCGINGCHKSYTNFRTFSNHVYDKHHQSPKAVCCFQSERSRPNLNDSDGDSDDDDTGVTEGFDECVYSVQDTECDRELCCSQQKCSATFLLGLKEKFKLTQVALQGVIQGVTTLCHQNMVGLKAQVCVATLFSI